MVFLRFSPVKLQQKSNIKLNIFSSFKLSVNAIDVKTALSATAIHKLTSFKRVLSTINHFAVCVDVQRKMLFANTAIESEKNPKQKC